MNQDSNINATLAERNSRYGDFKGHAVFTQIIKATMVNDWESLKLLCEAAEIGELCTTKRSPSQYEALEMIAHKIGRILNGDSNYADSWHDIAGYAMLVEQELNNKIADADHTTAGIIEDTEQSNGQAEPIVPISLVNGSEDVSVTTLSGARVIIPKAYLITPTLGRLVKHIQSFK
jgi:hypothetical protein